MSVKTVDFSIGDLIFKFVQYMANEAPSLFNKAKTIVTSICENDKVKTVLKCAKAIYNVIKSSFAILNALGVAVI